MTWEPSFFQLWDITNTAFISKAYHHTAETYLGSRLTLKRDQDTPLVYGNCVTQLHWAVNTNYWTILGLQHCRCLWSLCQTSMNSRFMIVSKSTAMFQAPSVVHDITMNSITASHHLSMSVYVAFTSHMALLHIYFITLPGKFLDYIVFRFFSAAGNTRSM